jgi:hypothetical protein
MPIDSFMVDTRIPTKPDDGAHNLSETREPEPEVVLLVRGQDVMHVMSQQRSEFKLSNV